MKKIAISSFLVLAFFAYIILTSPADVSRTVVLPVSSSSSSSSNDNAPKNPASPSPTGQYGDGTYKGISADAYYGYVQVSVAVSGGKVIHVTFLDYPKDQETSRQISARAMPILISEALTAQSAKVDVVSGATQTSDAFRQSLASALSKAKI